MHHLIFEGAELSGKSWLISQVYNYLEPKYNQSDFILDGCNWFNCDVGIYGTKDITVKVTIPAFAVGGDIDNGIITATSFCTTFIFFIN